MTPEVQERVHTTGTVHDWDVHRGLAAKGWIGAPWPVEDGGQGRDPWEMRVLTEEFALADAPTDGLSTATMIANTIRVVGTPDQKARVLPRVLAGEILLCMGYTEPQAGSDVANSQTTAVRDGDDWIVNGEKIYTSMAHESAYVFLLTRTNPDVPKHKGLTMFLVPMDTPGISVEPIWTLGAPGRTNRTVYEDVRVPDACRVGEVDGGWAVMNVALTFERGGSFAATRALRDALDWARDGGRLGQPDVRARLARVHVHNEVGSLLGMKSTYLHSIGALPGVEGSMAKLFSASTFQTSTADLLDLVGADGLLSEGEPGAPAGGSLEFQWRKSAVVTIYGGTNEIMRGIIAERGLGLPGPVEPADRAEPQEASMTQFSLGVLPSFRPGVITDPDWVAGFARVCEDGGVESVWAVEHVLVAEDYEPLYPYSEDGQMPGGGRAVMPDPLEWLSFVAASTSRLTLGTAVLILTQHSPVQIAKRVATLDALSGGRVRLGVGIGWQKEEYAALNIPYSDRGGRLDEYIDAVRASGAPRCRRTRGST